MPEADLRLRTADLIDFIVSQLELSKNPADQLGAVAAASGAIPCLMAWTREDEGHLATLALLFHITSQNDWQENWIEMSKEEPATFVAWVDDAIGRLQAFRRVIMEAK